MNDRLDPSVDYADSCVHELFEKQAAMRPDAVAVVFGDRRLTYGEVNRRANQVAHLLRARGVGPETLVGVCLTRSPELVIALLAVWKAGGAYVPLDPAYPAERLAFMIADAGVCVSLTEDKYKGLFQPSEEQTVCLDSDWGRVAGEDTTNPSAAAVPANLAYVMYTSGSTGMPKGAMIVHEGLVNYLQWAIRAYAVEEGASVPVHSSIAFDLTVTSLYAPLLVGGHVELLPEDVGAQNLITALRRRGNRSLVKITPAHLELITQQLRPEELAGLAKTFVIGGESLSAESVTLWRTHAPRTRLINEYGPTETVVGCCIHEVSKSDPMTGPIPIGRAIANTQLYVLDHHMQPLPPGEVGELYIGGSGVARGYWNRAELTAERFVPDPFSTRAGARLYKSGDLARYRPDGTLEFLGRIDNQVKVRGYRIELGEIEATIVGHPAVQSCAVLAREDSPGNKQLVAYVVRREESQSSADELLAFVKRRLPEYMAPAHIVFLSALPLTYNGKVDRSALPPPSPSPSGELVSQAFVAPRNAIESAIASIWAELLRVHVSVEADFFQIGGHSLLAIKALAQIQERLGVDLPQETLFEHATVAALAHRVMQAKGSPADAPRTDDAAAPAQSSGHAASVNASSEAVAPPKAAFRSIVPIKKTRGRVPFFCVHGAGGNVLNFRDLARAMPAEQPFYGLRAYGVDGIVRPHATIEGMAEAYLREVRMVQPHGPYLLGGYSGGGIVAFEMAQRLTSAGEEVGLLVLFETFHPSVKMTKVTLAERMAFLRNDGPQYLKYLARRRMNKLRERWDRRRIEQCLRSEIPVPLTLRELQLWDNFAAATARYRPRPWNGLALLLRAEETDPLYREAGPRHGWERSIARVEVEVVAGNHHTLVLGTNAGVVMSALNSAIVRALSESPAPRAHGPVAERMNASCAVWSPS